eukprot:PhM_4_TR4286/c0_g1_i1/m.89799
MSDNIVTELAENLIMQDDISNKLEAFVDAHLDEFNISQDADPENLEDQPVQHTALHKQFQELLEGELDKFLTAKGVTHEEFAKACEVEMKKDDGNVAPDIILALADYKMFVMMMMDKKRARQ